MTDKERAEEYIRADGTNGEKAWKKIFEEFDCIVVKSTKLKKRLIELLLEYTREVFLDGLVEGRKLGKEEQWLATEKAQKKTSARIKELEKENAELKDDLILKLKAQIEKMKNVGNCKKSMTCAKWNEKQTMLGCMKFCKNCKEWELAE